MIDKQEYFFHSLWEFFVTEELLRKVKVLLEGQNLGVLGTSDHGHPYTSLIVYAELSTLNKIVFFTRRDRKKYLNLKSDSRVSIYIDSREKMARDPASIEGLTITGVAWQIKPGEEFEELKQLYINKNPHMDLFASDPESTMFRINVENFKYVVNFDEAHLLKV